MEENKKQNQQSGFVASVQLTDEQIAEFQEIYKEKFGVSLSKKEALESGLVLVNFMKLVYHISK